MSEQNNNLELLDELKDKLIKDIEKDIELNNQIKKSIKADDKAAASKLNFCIRNSRNLLDILIKARLLNSEIKDDRDASMFDLF